MNSSSRPARGVSIHRVIAALLIVAAVSCIGIWWSFEAEAVWFRDFRKGAVVSSAVLLSDALEEFHDENGHYPEDREDIASLRIGDAQIVRILQSRANAVGLDLSDIVMFPEAGEAPPIVLVVSGEDARVEFYRGGRIGVSGRLMPDRVTEHDRSRIIVLSDWGWPKSREGSSSAEVR